MIRQFDPAVEAEKLAYVNQYAFPANNNPESHDDHIEFYQNDKTNIYVGDFDSETLTSSITLVPHLVRVRGTWFKMGGIGGVSTLPEYRRGGRIRRIFEYYMDYMRENDFVVSALGPFSYQFYGKFGYSHGFNGVEISVPIEQLKLWPDEGGKYRRAKPGDAASMIEIYNKCTENESCIARRYPEKFAKKIEDSYDLPETYYYIYSDKDGNDLAYVHACFTEDAYRIREIFYKNGEGLRHALGFISLQTASRDNAIIGVGENFPIFRFVKEPWKAEYMLGPAKMFRVCNVEKFLSEIILDTDGEFELNVEDDFYPKNSGGYFVTVKNGKTTVKKGESKLEPLNIRQFNQIMSGFYTGSELAATDEAPAWAAGLDKFFPKQTCALYDHF